MICPQCGTGYQDGVSICADCRIGLVTPEPGVDHGIYTGNEDTVSEVLVNGKKLKCPVCEGTQFWTTHYLLNTRARTFMGWGWADRRATNKVCNSCGYVLWFRKK